MKTGSHTETSLTVTIKQEEEASPWAALKSEAKIIGKPKWRSMLGYVADLHEMSTHNPMFPLDLPWEEIGPGYTFGTAFGHWDIVHQIVDVLPSYPQHALNQLLNNIKNQELNGMIPGSIWMPGTHHRQRTEAHWDKKDQGHPPVWVVAVQDYLDLTDDKTELPKFYQAVVKQIDWFETCRKATVTGEGFYYTDITLRKWESGVDNGVRFIDAPKGEFACIDATSHVYWLYQYAEKWARTLGQDPVPFEKRVKELKDFIQTELYCPKDEMFYDIWAVKHQELRHMCFESMWPIVTGAATAEQADHFIDSYLMNPDVFFTSHPIASVGKKDPNFMLRLWRGPAWNSMTYWAIRGCLTFGRIKEAQKLAEKAMDNTAIQFSRTGTIWEFYHPEGGNPCQLLRKGEATIPCKDYLGHNPVFAITRIYDKLINNIPIL